VQRAFFFVDKKIIRILNGRNANYQLPKLKIPPNPKKIAKPDRPIKFRRHRQTQTSPNSLESSVSALPR
jgi:hypothetical protein